MMPHSRFLFVASAVCFAIALLLVVAGKQPNVEHAFALGGLLSFALGFAAS